MKQIDIFADKEFQSLDLSKKQSIANNYFDKEIADEEFLQLDAQKQSKIKENFVNAQIDFDVSDTFDKGVTALKSAFAPAYKEDANVTDPALHDAVAPNKDGSIPKPPQAATATKPFMVTSLPSDIVQSDDITATREFKPAEQTTAQIFNNAPVRMLSPSEQDAQTIEANKRTISMGENQDYVNPEASEWELGKRAVNRINELTSNAIQGTYNLLGNIKTPMEYLGITTEAMDAQNLKRADWFKDASDKLNDFVYEKNKMQINDDFFQRPTHSWQEVKKGFSAGGVFDVDAWQELGNYIGSEGVVSAPDMAEMVAAMPLYYAARQQESAEHRAKNNNRKAPTANDYLMTAPTTMGSIILDRLGLKATTEDVVKNIGKQALDGSLKDAMTAIGTQMKKGFVTEGVTESFQNPLEKFGEEIGTKKGLSSGAEYADDALAGFTAGAGAGAGISGATATGTEIFNTISQAKQEKARDAYVQDAYNKQMMGSGLEMQATVAPIDIFAQNLDAKIKTIQSEFQNLTINHPEQVMPVEAVDSVEMQEQIVADAKANGLNVSDNNGLNAIDVGWSALQEELSSNPLSVDEELKPKGFVDAPVAAKTPAPLTIDTARLQELQQKTDDELTQDEKFEIEDLSANVNDAAIAPPIIEKPVVGEPEPEAKQTTNDIGQKVTYSTNVNGAKIVTTQIYDGLDSVHYYNQTGNGVFQKSKNVENGQLKSQQDYVLNEDGEFVNGGEINLLSGKSDSMPFIGTKEQRENIINLLIEKETASLERALEINNTIQNIVVGEPEPEAVVKDGLTTEDMYNRADGSILDKELKSYSDEELNRKYNITTSAKAKNTFKNEIDRRTALAPTIETKPNINTAIKNEIETRFGSNPNIVVGGISSASDTKESEQAKLAQNAEPKPIIEKPVVGEPEPEAVIKDDLTTQTKVNELQGEVAAETPTQEVNIDTEFAELQQHPRYKSLLDMRKDVYAKDAKYAQNLLQGGKGRELDGYGGTDKMAYDKAQYERNYNADFALTKSDVAKLEQGKIDSELLAKLKNDLGMLDNSPDYDAKQYDNYAPQEYERAYAFMPTTQKARQGTQGSLGFEGTQNALFDTTASAEYVVPEWAKPLTSSVVRYEDIITALTNAKNGKHSELSDRAMEQLHRAGSPHLEADIKRFDELQARWDLNEFEEQEAVALAQLLNRYLEEEENGKYKRDTTTKTQENPADVQTETRSDTVLQTPSSAGAYKGESKGASDREVSRGGDVKIVFDTTKVYTTKGIMNDTPSRDVSKKIQKDVAKYVQQLQKALGGWEVAVDKKGKPLAFMGVSDNLAPAGGSVSFKLYKPNSDVGVYVNLHYGLMDDGTYDAYKLTNSGLYAKQMYRTTNKTTGKDGSNQWIESDKLASPEFVRDIMKIVEAQERRDENARDAANSGVTDKADNTVGVPASKQNTPDTKASQGSNERVSEGDRRYDGVGASQSDRDGVSSGYGKMEGYTTDGSTQYNDGQSTDANGVLSRPDEPNSTETFSLEGKTPVALTKGQRKKFNAATLEIIQKPIEEITEADREVLRHYTGEGGLDDVNENSVNQHYTSYETVQAMYGALQDADVPMGRVLEPAVGSGNFVGFLPNASWDVVDIDTTNIEVVRRLYPQLKSINNESYETFAGKNYDLIISNVPFASEEMLLREHAMTIKPAFKAIHNFYFAHSMDKVKENGVIAFMTSTGTMDGTTTARQLRKYLMDRGDILGAFRLPEKSQAKNAHTDTMIDIIFIQKRPEGVKSRQEELNNQFVNIGNKDGFAMNEYFIKHPENLLGDEVVVGKDKTKMGKEGWIVRGEPKFENIKISYEPYKIPKKEAKTQNHFDNVLRGYEYAKENGLKIEMVAAHKPFSTLGDNGMFFYSEPVTFEDTSAIGVFGKEVKGESAQKALLLERIKNRTEDGIRFEDKAMLESAQEMIQEYKNRFEKAPHSDLAFKKFMKEHMLELQLKEFMSYFDKDFTPAPIYGEQVRFKDSGRMEISKNSPLIERAFYYANGDSVLDTSKEYEFLSKEEMQELVEKRSFVRSGANEIQLDFMYYSGNVYKKIDELTALYALSDSLSKQEYEEQLSKLKSIVPEQIPFKNITVKGAESWLPSAVQDKLLSTVAPEASVRLEVFDGLGGKAEIYNRYLNGKALAPKGKDESDGENVQRTMEMQRLLTETLIPEVMRYIEAQGLADILTDGYNRASNFFVRPEMTGTLLRELPKTFRGKPFVMQSHQLQGAEMLVFNKRGVLAFAPGGGKTITAIVAVMNLLQQGVMKKPLFVVPVNTIAQWEKSVKELYPNAKVFEFPKVQSGVNKGNAKEWTQLSREEKEQMAYDLANNRYDFTIIGDTMFQKFGLPSDILSEYVDELVEQIQASEEVEAEEDKKSKKKGVSAEAKKRALKNGLKAAYGGDVEFDFAKMGFDGLIADEVQYYKNIGLNGKDAKGGLGASIKISYTDKEGRELKAKDIAEGREPYGATLGSMRSYDFRFKSKYVSSHNNGNNVILLTGTPTPNKPLELYTLLQHLDENILKEYGVSTARDFVDTFYDVGEFETTDSTGKIVKRDALASMKNLNWLGNILDRYVNYKGFKDMPELPRPKQVDVQHYLKLSPAGEKIFQDVQHRLLTSLDDAKKVKSGNLMPDDIEISLVADGAGRAASIDLRLYDVGKKGKSQFTQQELFELIENDVATTENNKILKTIELVTKQYKENSNSGQIIFLDRLTVKNPDGTTTSTHAEIREKLLASGLFNPSEVVFVNGGAFVNPTTGNVSKSSIKPEMLNRIMDMYNEGKIKVIIGNTSKLGVGVDLNRKTTDIYQLDILYRPDEIEQRSNRGVRQGNENAEVRVHQFFQLGTLDKRSYDLVMKKRGFNDMYGFSENDDVVVVNGVSVIDNSNALDPYQAIIDLERDPFERERLRKQRVIDNAAEDASNIRKIITKLEADIKTKQGSIKNYSDGIKGAQENLKSQNLPKYENIKDENEKKEKLEKHIQGLNERIAKYEANIKSIETEIAEIEAKANERNKQQAAHSAETKFITDEFTHDGKNVSLAKIKEVYTLEQILRSEGKSEAEIAQYLKEQEREVPSLSAKEIEEQEEAESEILYSMGVDNAGSNYVKNIASSGFPERPASGTLEIDLDVIDLPSVDAPQTVESVREFLKDIIGNRLYDGRVKGKARLGFYNRVNSGVRVKEYHDIEVMAHEMAHFLDYFYKNDTKKAADSFFKGFKDTHKEFLKSVSYTQAKDKALSEGFAEFLRLYTTQYEKLMSIEGAGAVVEHFEKVLMSDKQLQKKIHTFRNEAHKYYYQGHIERMSAVSDSSLSGDAQKVKKTKEQKLAALKQRLVDKNLSIKMIEEQLMGKEPKDASQSPYALFNLVNGAEGTVDMAMEYGVPFVDANGDIGLDESKKSLDAIFKPLFDAGHKEVRLFENYAKARRASELMEQGRENRIDKQMIEASLKLVEEYPHFADIFAEYQEFNDAMLDFYVGMKLITEEQRENFKEFNSEYVPFNRVKESIAQGKVMEQVANAKLGTRLTGGTGTIANIMDNIYGNLERNIKDAYLARAKSALFAMLEKDGAEFAMKIGRDTKKVKGEISSQAKNVADVLYALGFGISRGGMIVSNGVDMYEDVMVELDDIAFVLEENPELLEMWSMGHIPKSKDKMIDSAIVDGRRVYFEINDALLVDTLTHQKGVVIENQLLKLGVAYKNASTFMITNNPLFYVTNALRDTVSAGVMSSNGFVPFYHTLAGMKHFVTKDAVYKNFMVSGGGYSTRRTALGSFDDINTNTSKVSRHFSAFEKMAKALAYGADMFEYGTRLGEFALSQKSGKTNTNSSYGAREISTDFSRSGSSENFRKFLGTVAFAKAGINSIDRMYRRFRDTKTTGDRVRFYMTGAAIATFSVALAALNGDDERYKKLTKDQKSMHWWIYLDKFFPKDTLRSMGINPVWKIPKPYDVGTLFANVPEMMFEYIHGNTTGDELKARFAFDLYRSGAIMDFPSVFKGALEVGFNKDWRGVPIESLGEQFKPKELRAKEHTPEVYKMMGNEFLSPAQLHHLTNSFLGLYGRMMDDAMEVALWDEDKKGERVYGKYNPASYLTSRIQGKEVEGRTKYDEKFYKLYKEMQEVHGEYDNYKKDANKEAIKKMQADKEKTTLYSLKKQADSVQKKLSIIGETIRSVKDGKIRKNGKMVFATAAEKEKEINRLLIEKQNLLEKQVKLFENKLNKAKEEK